MNRYETLVGKLKGEMFTRAGSSRADSLPNTDIEVIEQEISNVLPENYREFLRDYGGYAFFHGATYPLKDTRDGLCATLEVFYGVGGSYDLVSCYQKRVRNGEMVEMLTIAEDAGGNEVCLAIAGERRGSVWFVEGPAISYGHDNIYLVSDTFDAFIKSLYLRD